MDIKSLYLWTAQIKDIYSKSGSKIDLSELHRISLVRHKFITHIQETPYFKTSLHIQFGMILGAKDSDEVKMIFHSLRNSKNKFSKLNSVRKKALPYITELKNEPNVWNQINLFYSQINKITKKSIKEEVEKIILPKLGLTTEPPTILAKALLVAIKSYRISK
jgi:hypothetical protein